MFENKNTSKLFNFGGVKNKAMPHPVGRCLAALWGVPAKCE